MANLQQYGVDTMTIWDVSVPGAAVQYQVAGVTAKEWIDRGAGRYIEFLTPGVHTADPTKSGFNKIVIDSRTSFRGPLSGNR